ncbi:MAG: 5-bromo-4-chloroindolyl phosphate hydrolysis family protein [Paracoccaceae bacterium]
MAERYKGPYSPGRTSGANGAMTPPRLRRSRGAARSSLLFVVPFLFLPRAFGAEPAGLALFLVAFAALILAAWLTRDGLRAEEAYDARRVARRPAIPRKLFGSALTGLGLGLAGYAGGAGPGAAAIFAGLGAVLHGASFGIDPLRDKVLEGIDTFQQDRVARVVDEAETYLDAIAQAIRTLGDRSLNERVEQFLGSARSMCRAVEDDPRDLTRARKYLGVYLMGARDATVKFVDIWQRQRNAEARADYEALLGDLQSNFEARTKKLLLDDKANLDIEIEVLRDRLGRDGLVSHDSGG